MEEQEAGFPPLIFPEKEGSLLVLATNKRCKTVLAWESLGLRTVTNVITLCFDRTFSREMETLITNIELPKESLDQTVA